jgi:hypothetical protein
MCFAGTGRRIGKNILVQELRQQLEQNYDPPDGERAT